MGETEVIAKVKSPLENCLANYVSHLDLIFQQNKERFVAMNLGPTNPTWKAFQSFEGGCLIRVTSCSEVSGPQGLMEDEK